VLKENFDLLQRATDQDGNRLRVVALPMPKAVVHRGSRLPASYTNFYIANKAVLVPVFGDPNDKEAIGIIQKLFPERKAIGINCRAMVYGFGALHCATQQQPSPR
jgi:agmatine deiminase